MIRHPISATVTVVLLAIGIAAAWALCLWGVLFHPFYLVVWLLYVIVALRTILVVRNLEEHSGRPSIWTRIYSLKFRVLNWIIPWHRLPSFFGSLNLLAFRNDLREKNLIDTSEEDTNQLECRPSYRAHRTADGTFNDLQHPKMGAAGTRFGRNAPLDKVRVGSDAELLTPSPREVSRRLMTRDQFIPATTLNLLAAAWIQFQNHDWFNHRRIKEKIDVPLKPGDDWHENPMKISRTEPDPTGSHGNTPTFINDESHWWDASQIYGSSLEKQHSLRTMSDGKMTMEDSGLLPKSDDPDLHGIDKTGFNDNWWVGLSLLHTLFTMEHNSICDRLKQEFSSWDDEQLFQTARLINAALIAKIHTVEWTPGILAHPALQTSMNGNWWGLLREPFKKAFGRVSDAEPISGIVGSPTDHHAAPYYLTEEFVSVYRLHPLIPDDCVFRSLEDHSVIAEKDFTSIQGNATRKVMENTRMADLFYSFGIMHPGAITLHNFPSALQNFEKIKEGKMDLAAIDILRDRERGVPRYNDFREMLRLPRVKSFRKLTDNPQWAKEIEEVYDGDIDAVDTLVGMFAEPLPRGFGFSDTAFRIFILMASRRLKSDRFFTVDFTPQVYTQTGLDWVNDNNMGTVLKRHFPELTPALRRSENAFAPWSRVK